MGLKELLQSKGVPTSGIEVVVQQTNPKLATSINKSAQETVDKIVSSYEAPYKPISTSKAKLYTKMGEYDYTEPIQDKEITAGSPIIGYGIDQLQKAPIVGGFDVVTDFWNAISGSPAQKTDVIADVLDITAKENGEEKPLSEVVLEDPNKTGWIDQPIVTIPAVQPFELPKIELPNFSDIGKWLLIIAGGLGGIYLLGKYLGRGKK